MLIRLPCQCLSISASFLFFLPSHIFSFIPFFPRSRFVKGCTSVFPSKLSSLQPTAHFLVLFSSPFQTETFFLDGGESCENINISDLEDERLQHSTMFFCGDKIHFHSIQYLVWQQPGLAINCIRSALGLAS